VVRLLWYRSRPSRGYPFAARTCGQPLRREIPAMDYMVGGATPEEGNLTHLLRKCASTNNRARQVADVNRVSVGRG